MIMKIKRLTKYILSALALFWPTAVLALGGVNDIDSGLNSLQSAFGFGGLSGSQTAGQLIINVIKLMLTFAGIIAVVFVIIGGYFYVTSAGNEETAEKGKKTLINAIIGIVIIVLSYAIINVISRQLTRSTGIFF